MPTYSIPANSFVQAYTAPTTSTCCEDVKLCLPAYNGEDIAFQFTDNTPAADIYKVGVYSEGSLVGSFVELPKVSLGGGLYLVYVPQIPSIASLAEGQCFNLMIQVFEKDAPTGVNLFQTNCFYKTSNKCFTSRIWYRCDEDSFGFIYTEDYTEDMERKEMFQSIRLPFHLKAPQFPVKRNVFVKSNGERKKLSASIQNEYNLITDYMFKDWHEKLVVALEHDTILIENIDSGFNGQTVSHEADYQVDWQEFLNYPTAPGKTKLMKTPYYNKNTNC